MMACMAGNVEFARAPKQLRQLFQSPNAAIKGGILHVAGESAQLAPDDLSYYAWLAYRKAGEQRTGEKRAARPSHKAPEKRGNPNRRNKEKMALIVERGGAIDAIVVEVSIIY